MMSLQSYPLRKEQVIAQKASNDFLLFNMHDGNYYSLNEVGSRIWELCDGDHSVAQVVEALTTEYDVPTESLAQDVLELLEDLQTGKLIVEASRSGIAL
jgi:hypothetical protein